MSARTSVNWGSFSNGEDSVTAARDLLSIPNGYAAIMQNIEPVDGRPIPRLGCTKLTNQGPRTSVTWIGEYEESESSGWIIWLDGQDLHVRSPHGTETLLIHSWVPERTKISSVRIGKYLLLVADQEQSSVVLYVSGTSMKYIGAYIERGVTSSVTLEHVSGSFCPVKTSRMIAFTWVNNINDRTGVYALPGSTIPGCKLGMPSVSVESWENIPDRIVAEPYAGPSTDTLCDVSVTFPATISHPSEATHIRLYATLSASQTGDDVQTAKDKASGLALRWVADIPVSDAVGKSYKLSDLCTDASLSGCTNLAWSTNRDSIPPGGWVKFAGGRILIGGSKLQSVGIDNPGRVYASAIMDGAIDQLSRLLSFSFQDDYIDTSTDESEPCIGAAISEGHLILFNPSSIYCLKNADIDYSPTQISNIGCVGAICEINQRALFLSNNGPASVSGTVVELFPMKHEDCLQGVRGKSRFFDGRKIAGFFHHDSYIITDGKIAAAYLMRISDRGTWRLSMAGDVSLECNGKPSKKTCVVGGGSAPFYYLMDPGAVRDGNTAFLARLYTNATATPGKQGFGEAHSVSIGARWTDESQMKVVVNGDYGRVADAYGYIESKDTGAAREPIRLQRGPVLQGIRAGAASHWFQVGIEKYIWNTDTLFGPIELDIISRVYHAESISISDPDEVHVDIDVDFFGFQAETEQG